MIPIKFAKFQQTKVLQKMFPCIIYWCLVSG